MPSPNYSDTNARDWPGPSGHAVATTWGLLGLGHALAVIVAAVGLVFDARAAQLTSAMRAALVFNLVLGIGGVWLCARMFRATLRAGRLPEVGGRGVVPLVECAVFVLVSICLVVVAVTLWGATPPLLLAAAELAFLPLSLRTEAVLRAAR
ncbi:hypothetical protein [Gephyromycinifex aptenodytis]|uniref:hypothetical protein n=1 Tax=Gephyromycinifex aptenodytis TaxID=2716227 RepID=UPI0014452DDD|nr:hypothetical protein [Gephyromycinifex aptenodytis]